MAYRTKTVSVPGLEVTLNSYTNEDQAATPYKNVRKTPAVVLASVGETIGVTDQSISRFDNGSTQKYGGFSAVHGQVLATFAYRWQTLREVTNTS
jgi:hypothetical protein